MRKWNISDTRASKLDPILVKTKTDKDDCCITGLSVTNNGHLLVSDCYNKSVKLFSEEGKYITSCEIKIISSNSTLDVIQVCISNGGKE